MAASRLVSRSRRRSSKAVAAFRSFCRMPRARAGFAAIGAPYELAHTQRTHGAAHARLGERRRAAEALRHANRIFGELGAPTWQERTDDELRRVPAAAPRPRSDPRLQSTSPRSSSRDTRTAKSRRA